MDRPQAGSFAPLAVAAFGITFAAGVLMTDARKGAWIVQASLIAGLMVGRVADIAFVRKRSAGRTRRWWFAVGVLGAVVGVPCGAACMVF